MISRASTSVISAATKAGAFLTHDSSSSLPRRLPTRRQASVPWLKRIASWSLKLASIAWPTASRRALKSTGLPVPAEALGQRAQAVEALGGFAGAAGEDAELAAALRVEVHRLGGFEGAPFAGEIRVVVGKQEILAADAAAFVSEHPLALHGGGDEGGFRHAAVFVAGEHQPGKPRF